MHHERLDVGELPLGHRLAAAGWNSLWLDGDPSALAPPLAGLIGTRDADPSGSAIARKMAVDLVRAGVGVVSGGALGIDAAAHQGALAARGRTVVVLPCGLDHWYPPRHAPMYRAVLAGGGALVSQFPPATPPSRWTFPRRNELLATLADVVVVVQAPVASGALVAAACARRLGRRVMAVPASPGDRRGAGCLLLLRTGAMTCTSAQDVLDVLGQPEGALFAHGQGEGRQDIRPAAPARARPDARVRVRTGTPAPTPAGTPARARTDAHAPRKGVTAVSPESSVVAALDGDARLVYDSLALVPRHVDEIARLTGLPTSHIQQALLTLLLVGIIDDRGGGLFVLAPG